MNLRKVLILVLAASMTFVLSSCGQSNDAGTAGMPKGDKSGKEAGELKGDEKVSDRDTLVVAFDREPASLDPSGNSVTVKRMIESNLFDNLLQFDSDLKPTADLAESWEQVDELTWKFQLKKGVKFHNGEEMTSQDVVYSFKRLYDITTGSEAVGKIDPNGFETPDDYTFILKTIEPYAFLEAQLCSTALAIVPEEAVKEMGDEAFGRSPVGSGPYKFVSWTAGDSITIERNDEYWGEKSILKTIIFRVITENASRTIDLESGGVDITLGLPNTDADRIEENPDTQLIMSNSATIRYLALNCQKEIFKDKRVRQALVYATDSEQLRQILYGADTSAPMDSVVPSSLPGHNANLVPYEYNIDKAKQLLAEAGYPDGFSVEFMYLANSTNNMLAELLQEMWKQVNVTLVLKPTESGALTTSLNKGEQELSCVGTNYELFEAGAGLFNMFHTDRMYSSSARANLSSPEVDKVLDELVVTSDITKRGELIAKAQEMIHEEAPFIYLAFTKNIIGASSKVRGFDPIPTAMYDFRSVYFVE